MNENLTEDVRSSKQTSLRVLVDWIFAIVLLATAGWLGLACWTRVYALSLDVDYGFFNNALYGRILGHAIEVSALERLTKPLES